MNPDFKIWNAQGHF